MSADDYADGLEDSLARSFVRAFLKPFIDRNLDVKLILSESNGRHYVSVAQRLDPRLEGVYLLKSIPYPERHYCVIKRVYGDSVFTLGEGLELKDRPEMRVRITGKNLTQLTKEQREYLSKNGF